MREPTGKLKKLWDNLGGYGRVRAIYTYPNSRYTDTHGWIEPEYPGSCSYHVLFTPDPLYGFSVKRKVFGISSFSPEEEEKEERTMKKIQITFQGNMQSSERFDEESRCISEAFGVTTSKARFWLKNGKVVICRADQFGMLIALREKYGVACNRIKELSPQIIGDLCDAEDVTGN